jgi:hypothetical protein
MSHVMTSVPAVPPATCNSASRDSTAMVSLSRRKRSGFRDLMIFLLRVQSATAVPRSALAAAELGRAHAREVFRTVDNRLLNETASAERANARKRPRL